MSKTLRHELHLILSCKRVHKNFIRLCSKSHHPSCRRHLNSEYFIRVFNLSDWLAFIAIPKVYWSTLSAGYKFEFIIFPLGHTVQSTVLGLMAVHSLLLLQIIGRDGSILRAGMDKVRLVHVWEQGNDVFLLIYEIE